MNQRKLLSTLTFSVLSFATFDAFSQDSFKSEAFIATNLNDDFEGVNITTLAGGFRWYANAVDTDLGPWSELGFLSKSSFYGLNYLNRQDDYDFGLERKSENLGIYGRQFLMSNIFIDFRYDDHFNFQYNDQSEGRLYDNNSDVFNVGLGTYLNDTSSIAFNIIKPEESRPTYRIDYKNILLSPKGDFSHGYNASLAFNDATNHWDGALGYNFYPSRDWKLGASARFSYDKDAPSSFNELIFLDTEAEYFFNPTQSISFSTIFALNTPDDFFDASEIISLTYNHRF